MIYISDIWNGKSCHISLDSEILFCDVHVFSRPFAKKITSRAVLQFTVLFVSAEQIGRGTDRWHPYLPVSAASATYMRLVGCQCDVTQSIRDFLSCHIKPQKKGTNRIKKWWETQWFKLPLWWWRHIGRPLANISSINPCQVYLLPTTSSHLLSSPTFLCLSCNSCNKRMSRREIKLKAVNAECDFCTLHFRQRDYGED